MCENIAGGLSGLSMALYTRELGWDPQELEVFLVNVRKDLKDRSKHGYWPMLVPPSPLSFRSPSSPPAHTQKNAGVKTFVQRMDSFDPITFLGGDPLTATWCMLTDLDRYVIYGQKPE